MTSFLQPLYCLCERWLRNQPHNLICFSLILSLYTMKFRYSPPKSLALLLVTAASCSSQWLLCLRLLMLQWHWSCLQHFLEHTEIFASSNSVWLINSCTLYLSLNLSLTISLSPYIYIFSPVPMIIHNRAEPRENAQSTIYWYPCAWHSDYC